jgi:hypothetical protein
MIWIVSGLKQQSPHPAGGEGIVVRSLFQHAATVNFYRYKSILQKNLL